eukprot:1007902-Amphidinium_carterae.1
MCIRDRYDADDDDADDHDHDRGHLCSRHAGPGHIMILASKNHVGQALTDGLKPKHSHSKSTYLSNNENYVGQ